MLVFCNGMIRSGSTLQYNLVTRLVEELKLGQGEGFFYLRHLQAHAADIAKWRNDRAFHVLKCHDFYPLLPELLEAGNTYLCYIYRDLRDVALSAQRKWKLRDDNLLHALDNAVAVYEQVDMLQAAGAPVLVQRYEDVVIDLDATTEEIGKFLHLELTPQLTNEVVRACSMKNARQVMQQLEREINATAFSRLKHAVTANTKKLLRRARVPVGPIQVYDKHTLLHPDHISEHSGAIGVWTTQLSSEDQRRIYERYHHWLEAAGYLMPRS